MTARPQLTPVVVRRAADPTRLGMRALLATLCFLVSLSPSRALQCDCNDQFWLSDCRHNGWTCTAREGTGVCSTRVRLLSNGTIIRETKCLDKRFNPLHCSGGYNTDTDVWECCNDRDYCNTDLSPSLNLRATSSTQAPSSVVPSSSHIPTTSPSHTTSAASSSSAVPPTIDMSPPTPLPTPPEVSLVDPSPSVQEPSSSESSSLGTTVTSSPTPTLPTPPGMLRCECSRSLCPREPICLTNYKCFKDVQYIETSNDIETRLGCLDMIPEVNLGGIRVCDGGLETSTYKIECCDDQEFCNRRLDVVVDTTTTSPPDTTTTSPESAGDGDRVFLFLSVAVVLLTLLMVVVILSVLGVFCLRYRRDKAKVTSVDHLPTTEKNYLSNAKPTCLVNTVLHVPLHSNRMERNENSYV